MAASCEWHCSLHSCTSKDITSHAPRIEACTVLPTNFKSQSHNFTVKWSTKGEARFHTDCWKVLLKCARSRTKKANQLGVGLSEKAMVKEAAKTAEQHDGTTEIQKQGARIAEMILSRQHCVAFTGAGISTSAGIGDYRGKSGKWTEDDRARVAVDDGPDPEPSKKKQKTGKEDDPVEEEAGVPYEDLRPTYTHEALQKMVSLGLLKFIISQNGDGLHTLSGVPEDQLSELHGNVFCEKCALCSHRYYRPCYVLHDSASQYYEELEDDGKTHLKKTKGAKQCKLCGLSHFTGHKCSQKGCRGELLDTIINFRDHLEDEILESATDHATQADLMLCLGTTMTVTPACDLVEMGPKPLSLVICNRQTTALDDLATQKDSKSGRPLGSRVFGDCDDLMKEVMKGLLSEAELNKWESERPVRMSVYDKQRQTGNQK